MVNRIKALAEALEGSDVGELDLTESGLHIHIRRRLEAEVIALPQASPSAAPARPRAVRPNSRANGHAPAAAAPDPTVAVVSPMTGVFYASPSPNADPYVNVGDTIQAGQTVCLVEAMKTFNEIKSEIAGKVTAIVATPGNLVQKGDAMIRVQPV